MNLEVQKSSTHTFTFPNDVFDSSYWRKNKKVEITSAKITISDPEGREIRAQADMTISADTHSATYDWDSTDQVVGENYIAKFEINGVIYPRFFDIYYVPFRNTVTDDDIFDVDPSLKNEIYFRSGTADSGTVTTLVDENRIEENGYFDGGRIEFYFNEKTLIRKVDSFTSATKTFTFDALSQEVTQGVGYSVRGSFQDRINRAGEDVRVRLRQLDRRPYLLYDQTQAKGAIINRVLMNYYVNRRKEEGDEYDLKYQYYRSEYQSIFENTKWRYDKNANEKLEAGENNELTRIRFYR